MALRGFCIWTLHIFLTLEVNGDKQLFGFNILQNIFFVCSEEEKLIQVWNNLQLTYNWQNLQFWVNYPFKFKIVWL